MPQAHSDTYTTVVETDDRVLAHVTRVQWGFLVQPDGGIFLVLEQLI